MKFATLAATALAVCAAAPAAQAATITYDGSGNLVYTGDGVEANDVIAVGVDADTIRFWEYGGVVTTSYPADACVPLDGGIDCALPDGLIADLGGGDDELSIGSDFPAAMPITMYGGEGNDRLVDDYASATGRHFEGGPGNDYLEGFKGPDTLIGDAGDDEVKGGHGADAVSGGEGNDALEGDKYEDPSADVIDGGPGFDLIEEYSDPEKDVHPPATVVQDGVANDGRPGEGDNVTGVEKITSHVNGTYEGTDGGDEIWIWANMAGGDSVIRGLGGNDKLTGEDHPEAIDGGAGDDTIQGGYGNDTIVGGPGRDRINSDGGSYCGLYECTVPFGDDTIDARDGEADQVECGIGNDTVQADSADQVAPSCENVTVGGASGGTGGGHGPGGGPDQGGATPIAGFAFVGGRSVGKGVKFRVDCAAACQVSAKLTYKGRTVGRGRKTLLGAGRATVAVKLTRKGRKALERVRRPKVALKVAVKDPSGKVSTLSRKVRLKK